MEMVSFTEEDLRAAMYTRFVDEEVTLEQSAPPHRTFTTDEQKVSWYESSLTVLDLDDKEDLRYFSEHIVPENLTRYHHGQEVLKTCKVLVSQRSIVLGDNLYNEMVEGEMVVSPVITIPSGHIATSEAHRYVALALRKIAKKGA